MTYLYSVRPGIFGTGGLPSAIEKLMSAAQKVTSKDKGCICLIGLLSGTVQVKTEFLRWLSEVANSVMIKIEKIKRMPCSAPKSPKGDFIYIYLLLLEFSPTTQPGLSCISPAKGLTLLPTSLFVIRYSLFVLLYILHHASSPYVEELPGPSLLIKLYCFCHWSKWALLVYRSKLHEQWGDRHIG